MQPDFSHCLQEAELELYALGRLPSEIVPALEEHLLICAKCRDVVLREDEFSQPLIAALKQKT